MFSASQVSTFELCPRRWGWEKLENLRSTQHQSATMGVGIHEYLQDSVETRYWNTAHFAWPLIKPALKFLQSIPNDAELECYFELDLGGHKFRGYKDVQWLRAGIPCVVDHKSTGDLRYAKDSEDLLADVQATLYAHEAMVRYYDGEPGAVDLVWSYYRTRDAPSTKLTKLRVLPADIRPRLDKTIASADKMQAAIDAGKRAGDMTPDWDSCWKYGGCPFREHCEQEEQAKGTGIHVDDRRKALLEMINSKIGAPAAAASPATTPPAAPVVAINPPDENPEREKEAPAPAPTDESSRAGNNITIGVDPAGPAPEPPAPAAPKGQIRRKKSTLFVNCLPLSGKAPINASVLFVKAMSQLNLVHYCLADFGKGPGQFVAALRNTIEAEGMPDAVYLWTGSKEGRDAYETLVSYADNVIIGVSG